VSLTVARAPAYLAVQDFGRLSFREVGVPRCGAMDRASLGAANAVIGNEIGTAALEWALGGGTIRFDDACTFAVAGATVDAALSGAAIEAFTAIGAKSGDTLEIGRFTSGRFLYVAVHGGILVEELLGSASTYLPAHFGGVDGRFIRTGEVLARGAPTAKSLPGFSAPDELRPDCSRRTIRVVPGPQWSQFSETDRTLFFSQSYKLSRSSDRMGYRLDGEPLSTSLGLLPSEGACEGAIQIPPNGLPIVLMADSPTVGGYPKIGVIATADLGSVAQMNPGESVRFEQCSAEDAQRRLRRSAASLFTLRSLAVKS
jgi:5-oxoprolinase (ATP-hydrolysing) subunit C